MSLLMAFRYLLDRKIIAHLTIIGNGPDEARVGYWIRKLDLQTNVNLTGAFSYEEMRGVITSAHACIQSFLVDGVSNSQAEAMALGRPVFVTSSDGIEDVIRDGENGFLLSPLCPETWVDKLILAQDEKLMEMVGKAGYDTARRVFSTQEHTRKFMAFYDQAISVPKRSPRVDDAQPERTNPDNLCKVCIKGSLEWQMGADQVIRALAKACRPILICLLINGSGSQEDELRYLAYFLGYAHWEIFDTPSEYDVDMVINLPEESHGQWQVCSPRGDTSSVPFGDGIQLEKIFHQVLKTPSIGASDTR
jgi:Glycosyl transferases group 1